MIVLAIASSDTPLADRLIERWATSTDRAYATARRSQTARYHSLLARAGMRALLFHRTGQSEWNLRADGRGKLSAVDAAGNPGPAVCGAHTRGMIACALGDVRALGIDIEAYRPRDFSAIASCSFGPLECASVTAGDAATFYRIWTLREAMAKATGEGLALVTDRTDHIGGGPDEGIWRKRIGQQNWLLGHFRSSPNISVSIAALLRDGEAMEAAAVHRIDLGEITRDNARCANT